MGDNMKGIKVGVIVKKKAKGNSDKISRWDSENKQRYKLRAADPEAHQKFVNNLFSVLK